MEKFRKKKQNVSVSPSPLQNLQVGIKILIQGDQLYMVACFWYLVKSNLSIAQYTGQVTFYKVPEIHDHVYLSIRLYVPNTFYFETCSMNCVQSTFLPLICIMLCTYTTFFLLLQIICYIISMEFKSDPKPGSRIRILIQLLWIRNTATYLKNRSTF